MTLHILSYIISFIILNFEYFKKNSALIFSGRISLKFISRFWRQKKYVVFRRLQQIGYLEILKNQTMKA